MKKEIYRLFTLENGIILSQPVLNYISQNYSDHSSLQTLLNNFKSKYGTSSISIEQIKNISQEKKENTFNIKTFKYLQRDFNRKFQELKEAVTILSFQNKAVSTTFTKEDKIEGGPSTLIKEDNKAVPISFLKQKNEKNEENEDILIFGLFFKNKNGTFSLEDDFDTIELDMSEVKNEIFLFENIFIGVIGEKLHSKFKVKKFILPQITRSTNNTFLQDTAMKICLINDDSDIDEIELMKDVLYKERPDICVISTDQSINITELTKICKNIIRCPTRRRSKYIPIIEDTVIHPPSSSSNISLNTSSNISLNPSSSSSTNLSINPSINPSTNPFIIETFKNSIGFVDFNVFEERKKGILIGCTENSCPIELFLKSMFSQRSLVPFSGSDLPVEKYPNILVVSQDFQPLVTEVEGIKFMSLPGIKERYYGVISDSNCEVKRL